MTLPQGFILDNPNNKSTDYGYGLREDKTQKGKGYFGEIPVTGGKEKGKIMGELSIGINLDGKEELIPTIVPTLSENEINYLSSGNKPTKEIINKAVDFARKRKAEGKPYFALPEEEGKTKLSTNIENTKTSSLPEGFILDENQESVNQPLYQQDIIGKSVNKLARLGAQGAIGAIQGVALPYDIAVTASKFLAEKATPTMLRENIFSEIEDLAMKKQSGNWNEDDQKQMDYYTDLIKNPDKMLQFFPKDIPSFDSASLIEKGAEKLGVDLRPQGIDEMALRWTGFIKDPRKAQELMKNGMNPQNAKNILKELIPKPMELARGVGAASALQYAAEAELGPIGTMAALVIGDLAPQAIGKGGKAALEFAKSPSKSLKKGVAKTAAFLTSKDKIGMQKAIIQDFQDAGLHGDIGTITGNGVIKWLQNTLAHSSLTGSALEEFKNTLTKNILKEYKNITSKLGDTLFESKYEAGTALKEAITNARDLDIGIAKDLYKEVRQTYGETQIPTVNIASKANELESSLASGSVKSPEQKVTLNIIQDIKKDILTPEGAPRSATLDALINDKIALNDIIDYEVQGGTKQLLKGLVKEIDNAIESVSKETPELSAKWKQANQKFAEHAKLFRGKVINDILKGQDVGNLLNKMNTEHGINEIRKALSKTPEGKELFNQLSLFKVEELIGKNMVDGLTNQIKFGTFANLLSKGQNRAIIKNLLGETSFKKLENLQKASGRIAEAGQKFMNTSKTAYQLTDVAATGKLMKDFGAIFSGNFWPLAEDVGSILGMRKLARLITDPEVLSMVEDMIMESENGTKESLIKSGLKLNSKIKTLEPALAASLVNIGRAQNKE